MKHRIVIVALAAAVSACGTGSGESANPPDYDPNKLTLVFAPLANASGACTPKRTTISHARTQLYRVENKTTYSAPGENPTRIPGQAVFQELEGQRRFSATAVLNFSAACEAITITLEKFECSDGSNQAMECPPVEVLGTEHFADIVVAQ